MKHNKYIHVICSNKMWKVIRSESNRSLKNFKYRDLAFNYAVKFGVTIMVYDKDGNVEFVHNCD